MIDIDSRARAEAFATTTWQREDGEQYEWDACVEGHMAGQREVQQVDDPPGTPPRPTIRWFQQQLQASAKEIKRLRGALETVRRLLILEKT